MFYYGGGSFNSFPNSCCTNWNPWFGSTTCCSGGWNSGWNSGWGFNNNNNYAIILVLFILLVIVIGARITR